jgi:hypothetical protein
MAGNCFTPDAASAFAAKDTNRLVGRIAQVLAYRSPLIDILNGGKLENVSDTVRSVVQEQAVLAASLAKPVFTDDVSMCGAFGGQDQVGSTEYSYKLQSLRGRGPRVCVKTSRTSFRDSYLRAQEALQKGILKIRNADIKSNLHLHSGVKFVCRTDLPFSTLITGDSQQIDTLFYNAAPNAPLSFRTLHKLGTVMREELLCDPFESDKGTMFKYIGSADSIEIMRNELGVKDELKALTTGRYTIGEQSLDGYSWEGPYRGFGFGIDQQPLRATANNAGVLTLVEPEISVPVSNGVASRRNPAWIAAPYEVGFLIAADSFEYLTPIPYTGEATFKFSPQLYSGELEWFYQRDNDCNMFGDFGQHIYQISRAYRPVRPHAVIPILYLRCQYDLGLVTCDTLSSVLGL